MNESTFFMETHPSNVNESDIFNDWNGTILLEPLHNTTLLLQLNDARRLVIIPVVVLLLFLMLIGMLGNGLVIVIYSFYSPKTSANFFILVLAITDFVSCVAFIPFSVYDLWNPYINALPTLCRIMRSLENQFYLFSGFVFICIACERYVKICYPFHLYTIARAKSVAFIVFVISFTLTWPQFVMYGHRTMIIGPDRVIGEDCSLTDEFKRSIYSLLYHYLLYSVYIMCCIMFFFFYGNILHVIFKRRWNIKNMSNGLDGKGHDDSLRGIGGIQMRSSRTTLCLTTVTFNGIASFVPYLTLLTLRSSGHYFKETVTPSGEFYHYGSSLWSEYTYMFGLRSYFWGSVANPIIYSIMNPNFRNRSKIAFRNLQDKLSIK